MSFFKYARRVTIALALGTAVIASGVNAQTVSLQPPSISVVDRNGVDLVGGSLSIDIPGISAGGSDSGISRVGSGYNLPYGDNLTGVLNGSLTGTVTISLGGNSEKFTWNGAAFVSAIGSLNSFSCTSGICSYTLADGTLANFDTSLTANIGIQANIGAVTRITKPDGEILKFYYKRVPTSTYVPPLGANANLMGVRAVTSSLGWMVKYELATGTYAITPTKIYIINTSLDYCDPTLDGSCADMTHSTTWPTLVVGGSGSATTYTQILNATTQTGPITSLTSSSSGMVLFATGVTSPTGVAETATFSGTTVSTVTAAGKTWTYSFGATSGTGTNAVTDPNGGVRTVVVSVGLVQSDQDEMGRITKYTYDSSKRVTRIIHPDATYTGGTTLLGGYTQYAYDTSGHLTDVTEYGKDGTSTLTSHANYPTSGCNAKTCNKPTYVIDSAGIRTDYTYDANNGNVATETKPTVGGVAPLVRYTYNPITPYNKETSSSPGTLAADVSVSRLTQVSTCMSTSSCGGGADEVLTTISYSGSYNVLPTSVTRALGNGSVSVTTTTSYDSMGNVTSIDGPISGTDDASYAFYDLLNRKTGVIGTLNGASTRATSQIVYNNSGQVTSVKNGSATGTTSLALSGMTVLDGMITTFDGTTGLPTIAVYNFGSSSLTQNITETSYDNLFRTLCSAVRMNGTTNGNACTVTSGSNTDRISKTIYNASSQVLSTINGFGTTNARQDFVKFFNSNGTLATMADNNSQTTGYTYDTFNRLIKTCFPDKINVTIVSTSDCQSTGYTGAVATSVTVRNGLVETLSYDAVGRLSGRSATGISESISYNNFSQVTSHTNNGLTETYTYHPLWGLLSDAQPMGTVSYSYDSYGRRSQLNYPASAGVPFNVTYAFRNDSSLQSQSVSYNSGAAVQQASYGVDSFGRLNSFTSGPSSAVVTTPTYSTTSGLLSQWNNNLAGTSYDSTLTYSYNPANQITGRTQTGSTIYNYNPTVNNTTTNTLNGLNQITAANSSLVTYDNRGNLSNDGAVTYSYNSDNLLISTSAGATLTYDASNRLLSTSNSTTTFKFLYDGSDLIAEYDGSNNLLRRYVHGPGTDNPLVWFEGAGVSTPRYFTTDQQGSVTAVTDSGANAIGVYAYNEYGLPVQTAGSTTSRFQYTGQTWVPEVGLYYYKARMYAPSLGRFMQTDPIGYGDGLNMYNYVHGDPLNGSDPSGLQEDCSPVYETYYWVYVDKSGHSLGYVPNMPPVQQQVGQTCHGSPDIPSHPPQNNGGGGGGPTKGGGTDSMCPAAPYDAAKTPNNLPKDYHTYDAGNGRTDQFMQKDDGTLAMTPDYQEFVQASKMKRESGHYILGSAGDLLGLFLGTGTSVAGQIADKTIPNDASYGTKFSVGKMLWDAGTGAVKETLRQGKLNRLCKYSIN